MTIPAEAPLPPGARRLRNLRVVEVSVVGSPAVPGAQIALAKSRDGIAQAEAAARSYVTKGEVRAAAVLARDGTPAPRSFWAYHLDALAKQIAPDLPPAMAMNLALRHPDGQAFCKALARSA